MATVCTMPRQIIANASAVHRIFHSLRYLYYADNVSLKFSSLRLLDYKKGSNCFNNILRCRAEHGQRCMQGAYSY